MKWQLLISIIIWVGHYTVSSPLHCFSFLLASTDFYKSELASTDLFGPFSKLAQFSHSRPTQDRRPTQARIKLHVVTKAPVSPGPLKTFAYRLAALFLRNGIWTRFCWCIESKQAFVPHGGHQSVAYHFNTWFWVRWQRETHEDQRQRDHWQTYGSPWFWCHAGREYPSWWGCLNWHRRWLVASIVAPLAFYRSLVLHALDNEPGRLQIRHKGSWLHTDCLDLKKFLYLSHQKISKNALIAWFICLCFSFLFLFALPLRSLPFII